MERFGTLADDAGLSDMNTGDTELGDTRTNIEGCGAGQFKNENNGNHTKIVTDADEDFMKHEELEIFDEDVFKLEDQKIADEDVFKHTALGEKTNFLLDLEEIGQFSNLDLTGDYFGKCDLPMEVDGASCSNICPGEGELPYDNSVQRDDLLQEHFIDFSSVFTTYGLDQSVGDFTNLAVLGQADSDSFNVLDIDTGELVCPAEGFLMPASENNVLLMEDVLLRKAHETEQSCKNVSGSVTPEMGSPIPPEIEASFYMSPTTRYTDLEPYLGFLDWTKIENSKDKDLAWWVEVSKCRELREEMSREYKERQEAGLVQPEPQWVLDLLERDRMLQRVYQRTSENHKEKPKAKKKVTIQEAPGTSAEKQKFRRRTVLKPEKNPSLFCSRAQKPSECEGAWWSMMQKEIARSIRVDQKNRMERVNQIRILLEKEVVNLPGMGYAERNKENAMKLLQVLKRCGSLVKERDVEAARICRYLRLVDKYFSGEQVAYLPRYILGNSKLLRELLSKTKPRNVDKLQRYFHANSSVLERYRQRFRSEDFKGVIELCYGVGENGDDESEVVDVKKRGRGRPRASTSKRTGEFEVKEVPKSGIPCGLPAATNKGNGGTTQERKIWRFRRVVRQRKRLSAPSEKRVVNQDMFNCDVGRQGQVGDIAEQLARLKADPRRWTVVNVDALVHKFRALQFYPTISRFHSSVEQAVQVQQIHRRLGADDEVQSQAGDVSRLMWARSPAGLVQLVMDIDRPKAFQSDLSRIMWDTSTQVNLLRSKADIQQGQTLPQYLVKQLGVTEQAELERKRGLLRWLRMEALLLDLNQLMRINLHTDSTPGDVIRTIAILDAIINVPCAALVVKKHYHLVETALMMRQFDHVGCVQPAYFLRQKSEVWLHKLTTLLGDSACLRGDFAAAVLKFQYQVARLPSQAVYGLTMDPQDKNFDEYQQLNRSIDVSRLKRLRYRSPAGQPPREPVPNLPGPSHSRALPAFNQVFPGIHSWPGM